MGGEVGRELRVEVEPPARGGGDHEVIGAAPAQPLQLVGGASAVKGVVPGVAAAGVLREVQGVHPRDLEQGRVALVDDEQRGARRQVGGDRLLDPADQVRVLGLPEPAVALRAHPRAPSTGRSATAAPSSKIEQTPSLGRGVAAQVRGELGVVREPPGGRLRQHQVLGAALARRLEPGHRVGAVVGVIAEIAAVVVVREVDAAPPVQIDQLAVAAADHEHRGPGWHPLPHGRPDPLDRVPVAEPAARGEPRRQPRAGPRRRLLQPLLQRPHLLLQPVRLAGELAPVELAAPGPRLGLQPLAGGLAQAHRRRQADHLAEQVGDLTGVEIEQLVEASTSRPESTAASSGETPTRSG